MVRAAVEGLQAGGVVATLKHFPGHGDTGDRHAPGPGHGAARSGPARPRRAGAVSRRHRRRRRRRRWSRTSRCRRSTRRPGPATFSAPIVAGLLRRDLGFDGVIYTDSMLMDAVNKRCRSRRGRGARGAEAGADVVLDPPDLRASLRGAQGRRRQRAAHAGAARSVGAPRAHATRRGWDCTCARTVNLDGVMTAVGTRAGADTARVDRRARRDAGARRPRARCRWPLPRTRPRALPVGARLSVELADRRAEPDDDPRAARAMAVGRRRWSCRITPRRGARAGAAMAASHDAVVIGVFVRARVGQRPARSRRRHRRLLQRSVAPTRARRKQPLVAAFFGSPYAAVAATALPAVLAHLRLRRRRRSRGGAGVGRRDPGARHAAGGACRERLPVGFGLHAAGGRHAAAVDRGQKAAVLDLEFRHPRALSSVG